MPVRVRLVIRHVIALLLSLAVFHLTLVDSALAPCSTHGASDMSDMPSSGGMAMGHEGSHRSLRDASAPAQHHAAPDHNTCCDAGAPCGLLAIASQAANESQLSTPDRFVHAEPGSLRLSGVPTPEPPPPKA